MRTGDKVHGCQEYTEGNKRKVGIVTTGQQGFSSKGTAQYLDCCNKYTKGGSVGKESACNAGDLGSIPGLGRSLEKGMATHSSILAWRIPQTEELGRLQSMRSQSVRNDKATKHAGMHT